MRARPAPRAARRALACVALAVLLAGPARAGADEPDLGPVIDSLASQCVADVAASLPVDLSACE